MSLDVAVSGDWIINRRVSTIEDRRFVELIDAFRSADVGYAHLETLIHDYDSPETYPAAEAGGTWMRSPDYVATELDWAGLDMVSLAFNHSLDYGYGGLHSTYNHLDDEGIAHAGVGENLGDARAPAYIEIGHGRVALISMATSFTRWSRAGESRRDLKGRPGLNPLRYHFEAGPETLRQVKELASNMGWWVTQTGENEWTLNPPGLHNTTYKYVETDRTGIVPVLDGTDRNDNLRVIRSTADQADLVIVHLHSHEWDTEGDISDPAPFVQSFARSCIDVGADVFVSQGSHSPLRGVEIYDGRPIFYDPGDFFLMSDTVTRLPAEFYERYSDHLESQPAVATPADGLNARGSGYTDAEIPPGGYHTGSVMGNVVPICSFEDDELVRIELIPGRFRDSDRPGTGVPVKATGQRARDIVEEVVQLSDRYGTAIEYEDGRGVIDSS